MTNPAHILVGVDGSHACIAAIRYGAHEAKQRDTALVLAHVAPAYLPIVPMIPLEPSDLEGTGRQILRAAAEEAGRYLEPEQVSTLLLEGARVSGLVRAAERAGLVVLGSEKRPTIERLLTGTTLVGVAARAVCPVVVVPPDWIPAEEHRPVVVGVKSTEHSAELVTRALEVAKQRGARVVLVHAWELPNAYDDLITSRVQQDEWAERARGAIERSLSGTLEQFTEVQVEIQVVHGQPARVLQRASSDADLLLLARRRHAFPLGHLGGTGRALLREAHCPVEVLPPADVPAASVSGPVA